jgi:cupin fold WbuC family metalloprotein
VNPTLFDSKLLDDLAVRAAVAPRRRAHLNVHPTLEDPVQRLFVATMRDSYFRPHRHPEKWELAIVLRGSFDLVTFDDDGRVTGRFTIGPRETAFGFQLPAATWHSWIPNEDGSIFFEVKQGPYDPATIAEPAPWAPEEGSPNASAFAEKLRGKS